MLIDWLLLQRPELKRKAGVGGGDEQGCSEARHACPSVMLCKQRENGGCFSPVLCTRLAEFGATFLFLLHVRG